MLLLDELKMFLVVLTPITLPSKSQCGEALTTYSPQLLLRQFGFDQGAVLVLGNPCISVWEVESWYVGVGRDTLLGDFNLIFNLVSRGRAFVWLEGPSIGSDASRRSPILLHQIARILPCSFHSTYSCEGPLHASRDFEGSTMHVEEAGRGCPGAGSGTFSKGSMASCRNAV